MRSPVPGAEELKQTGSLSLRRLLFVLTQKFYPVSLNPELHNFFCKGHGYSIDGVDWKVTAETS